MGKERKQKPRKPEAGNETTSLLLLKAVGCSDDG